MLRNRKPFVDADIQCPNCNAFLKVKAQREVVQPAVPAKVEIRVSVEKLNQATLEQVVPQ